MSETADEFRLLRAEITRLLAAAASDQRSHDLELRKEQNRHDAEVAEILDGYDDETRGVMDAVRDMASRVREDPSVDVQRIHDETVAALREALVNRDVIGQAKGIIMITMRCTADEAFQLLSDQSMHENRKVRDIAAEVARRAQNPVRS